MPMTLADIRGDLKDIRFYYSHKDKFEKASTYVGAHSCLEKVNKYNSVIKFATPRLYELYVSLYIENNTLESWANKEGYSYVHIQRIHGQLVKFFQEKLGKKEEV